MIPYLPASVRIIACTVKMFACNASSMRRSHSHAARYAFYPFHAGHSLKIWIVVVAGNQTYNGRVEQNQGEERLCKFITEYGTSEIAVLTGDGAGLVWLSRRTMGTQSMVV